MRDINITKGKNNLWHDVIHAIESLCFLPFWHLQRCIKRDPNLWTFDAWSGRRYSDSPRALYEYVLSNEPSIRVVWMTNSKAVYSRLKNEGKPVVMRKSAEGIRIQKKAGYFFCTHGRLCGESEGELRYMNGIHYVNLWHGVPLKLIGDDETQFKTKTISKWKKIKTFIRKGIMPWEFLTGTFLCGSSFFEPFIKSAFGRTYHRIIINPEPRLDNLYVPKRETLIEQIDQEFNSPLKVLYMPTFRDSEGKNFNPLKIAGFEMSRFAGVLEKSNVVFLYKGHFLSTIDDDVIKTNRFKIIGDSDYDDLYTFIKDVDVLITDYSSIYFDFICTHKPMILFPFDYNEYTSLSRGFYFNYDLMEAKKVYTWQELEECITTKTYHSPTNEELQRFRPHFSGNCCAELIKQLQSK